MAFTLTHNLASFMIPNAERDDPEPVISSLARARADFERGALREALRHLRHAAAGADEAGSDLRAVALARAAADLANQAGPSVVPAPSVVPPAVESAVVPAVASNASPSVVPEEVPSAVFPKPGAGVVTDAVIAELLASGRAVRVAIKRSVRDEGLYVVRRAETAEKALGTRQAVVILLENDDGFFEDRDPR
jgi:hypothetical protein